MEKAESYKKRIKLHTPPSALLKDSALAFLFGGAICLIGELLATLYIYLGISEKDAYTLVSVTLIFISALMTGLGIFDNIARHAGAGTLVPVTGFANSVVSPAIDNRSEGLILGVGAKIFTVAGPVILYAVLSGTVFGIIYYITKLFI
ncbi:MAG: stage V sporulation protein AC [Clostridia bacterium]|nr:stage V sporulation protein AC [Clostridia bacterium]